MSTKEGFFKHECKQYFQMKDKNEFWTLFPLNFLQLNLKKKSLTSGYLNSLNAYVLGASLTFKGKCVTFLMNSNNKI